MTEGPTCSTVIKNQHDVLPTNLQLFELLFPMDFVRNIMIPKMNKRLGEAPITYGLFLGFLGLWFLMATTNFAQQNEFWATKNNDPFDGTPFCPGNYISCYHFLTS